MTVVSSVFILTTGTALAQLLAALASPVLTRLYSPKEFGLLSAYIAILSLISLYGTLQYENAITIPKEDSDAADVLVLSFIILLMVSIIIGVCVGALGIPLLKLWVGVED